MSKFKVGDKVLVFGGEGLLYGHKNGDIGHVIKISNMGNPVVEVKGRSSTSFYAPGIAYIDSVGIELVEEDKGSETSEDIIKTKKQTTMSKITTFVKNLTLSADEKLLRKYSLKNDCGEFTDQAREAVIEKLVADNQAYLITIAKGLEAEEVKNK